MHIGPGFRKFPLQNIGKGYQLGNHQIQLPGNVLTQIQLIKQSGQMFIFMNQHTGLAGQLDNFLGQIAESLGDNLGCLLLVFG